MLDEEAALMPAGVADLDVDNAGSDSDMSHKWLSVPEV